MVNKKLPKLGDVIMFREPRQDSKCRYVVTRAVLEGGSREPGGLTHNDTWPDGLHVTVRELNPDGTYNPDGRERTFYMTGCFRDKVTSDKIAIVGKMQQIFVPVDKITDEVRHDPT